MFMLDLLAKGLLLAGLLVGYLAVKDTIRQIEEEMEEQECH